MPALRGRARGGLPALDPLPPVRLHGLLQPQAGRVGDPDRPGRSRHPAAARLRPRQGAVDVPGRVRGPRRVRRGGGRARDRGGAQDGDRARSAGRRLLRARRTRRADRLPGRGARRAADHPRGHRGARVRPGGHPVGRACLLEHRGRAPRPARLTPGGDGSLRRGREEQYVCS